MATMPPFNVNSKEGKAAVIFIVIAFVLMLLLLITCIVCWCWRYKLHKRKHELKVKDAENGIATAKKTGCGCCGCWVYCCRCFGGCCQPVMHVASPLPAVVAPPTGAAAGGCGCHGGSSGGGGAGNQFGWTKDVIVYGGSGGTPVGPTTNGGCSQPMNGCSSQPVNFNNRWSTANDGRLVLNGGGAGVVSKFTPGVQTYGGIYPSMPSGMSASNQFLLNGR